jgi:hypothetical protein
LTCPDDDNQWFWGGHLVHVSWAGSDMWLGFDKNGSNMPIIFQAKILPDDIQHPQSQSIPCSSMPSSLDMCRWW